MAAAGGVHILGAGSIGLVFGEALASRGIPCTLLLRNQAKLAALSALGGKVTVDRPSAASSSYQVAGEIAGSSGTGLTKPHHQQQQQNEPPIKRLLVTTKATDAVPAIASVKHRLSSDSVVLLLTNGVLGVYMDAVRTLFPPGGEAAAAAPSFLLGMTTHGAYRTGDFSVMHCGQGSFVAGQPCQHLVAAAAAAAAAAMDSQASGSSASSTSTAMSAGDHHCQHQRQQQQQRHELEDAAGQAAEQHQQQQRNIQETMSMLGSLQQLQPDVSCTPEQLQQQLLLKLLINCCSNPLSGLLHCRNGGLPGNPYAEDIWRHIIAECKAVFGDELPGSEQELFDRVYHVVHLNSQNYNSMLQDVMRRGPTEIEYLNGFVVRQGAAAGVATPYNEMLSQLMRARTAVPHQLLTNESM